MNIISIFYFIWEWVPKFNTSVWNTVILVFRIWPFDNKVAWATGWSYWCVRVGGSPQNTRHNNSVLSRANVGKAEQTLTLFSWSPNRVEVRGDFTSIYFSLSHFLSYVITSVNKKWIKYHEHYTLNFVVNGKREHTKLS